MNWLQKFRYRCAGIVEGLTQITEHGENIWEWRGYWVLSENGFGNRKFKYIGPNRAGSPLYYHRKASVMAWTLGGPLPDDLDTTAAYEPVEPKKPRKSAEVLRLVKREDA